MLNLCMRRRGEDEQGDGGEGGGGFELVAGEHVCGEGGDGDEVGRGVPDGGGEHLPDDVPMVERGRSEYLRRILISSQRMPEMRWRKDFSHDCSLISFMPSSASVVVLMRWSFTFISSVWILAKCADITRANGIISRITTVPASVERPSYK